jgi:hypothetical protein
MSGSPTRKRRADPTATAIFIARVTVVPAGVVIVPVCCMASCMPSAAAQASVPSSPSSQHVMASPEK